MLFKNVNEIIIETENSSAVYKQDFLTETESEILFKYLFENINWQHDSAKIYGKTIITKRKIAWFADIGYDYNYSGSNRIAIPWDKELLKIKERLENETGTKYNSCLLNLYHDGNEGMAFHSDDQNHLIPESSVAIISLGTDRFMKFRETLNKTNQRKITLEIGSLLLMNGQFQKYWQHEIPKMMAVKTVRISLTWRSMKSK